MGFGCSRLRMLKLSKSQAEEFYKEHKGRPFYEPLIGFMTSAPIVAAVWEGDGAVSKVRALLGSTNSPEAAPGTLRRDYGTDNRRNLVHGSDSPASAHREIGLFFQAGDLQTYGAIDWQESVLKG